MLDTCGISLPLLPEGSGISRSAGGVVLGACALSLSDTPAQPCNPLVSSQVWAPTSCLS